LSDINTHEQIINSLKLRAGLEIIIIKLAWQIPSTQYSSLKERLLLQGWQLQEHSLSSAEHFSDRISVEFDVLIGLRSNYFEPSAITAMNFLSPTPAVPNGMSPKLLVEFNNSKYALPYVGEMFDVDGSSSEESSRNPLVEYIVRQKERHQEIPAFDAGFQIYHKDSPAPLPSTSRIGLFGSLFGITFPKATQRQTLTERKVSEPSHLPNIRLALDTDRIIRRISMGSQT
jgi:hypothetical protein